MEEIGIAPKLRALRAQKKLSIRKLASMAGITASMLSQIENEQVTPSIQTLRSLAAALEIPMYDFFREEPRPAVVVTPQTRMTIGRQSEPDVR